MNFRISNEIIEKYPSLKITLIVATSIKVSTAYEETEHLLKQQEEIIYNTFQSENLSLHPHIESWRKVYSSFGASPSKYPCAVEFLIRLILKRGKLPRINSIVNLCNYSSVKHVLPIDVIDLDRIEGDIKVHTAKGNERFFQLGSQESTSPYEGEVIYSDATDALGRRWNWKKCDKTKVTPDTKNILIIMESIENIKEASVRAAELELKGLLQNICTGTVESYYTCADIPQVHIGS